MSLPMDLAMIFLPLGGAGAAFVGGKLWGDKVAQLLSCAAMFLAAILACLIFREVALEGGSRAHIGPVWIDIAGFSGHWAMRLDRLSSLMLAVVGTVSALVHFYAVGYMAHDKSVPRFMAYLSLFTFFMFALVTADDLLQLFFGWEGVGLCSYLLIGFYLERPRATQAAMKAFLVNRVGDFGFLLGIFGCHQLFGTLEIEGILRAAPQAEAAGLTLVALLLLTGAMGKSAQIGLHTWLPDAMEGPTPVSALIHAATMVTAGVFLLARLAPLYAAAPLAQDAVALIGGTSIVFAASIALTEFDIKRVIAYSTMSQLGYMFLACGVGAEGAAMFHLATHAFFKALLFLGAGCVIHALEGEQDMRRMGGLARKLPVTYGMMLVGAVALSGIGVEGVFGFSGFYSKEAILAAAFARGTPVGYIAWGLGLAGAFMTAFYICRLLILTFHGEESDAPVAVAAAHAHAHEAPWTMLAPLFPLALGAVLGGVVAKDFFVAPASAAAHGVGFLPSLMALAGFGLAVWLYLKRPDMHERLVAKLGPVHKMAARQFYVDEIYDRLFIRPVRRLGHVLHLKVGFFDDFYDFLFVRVVQRLGAALWRKGDEALIDRLGPDGVAKLALRLARASARAQTGYMPHYAALMIAGLALFLGLAFVRG